MDKLVSMAVVARNRYGCCGSSFFFIYSFEGLFISEKTWLHDPVVCCEKCNKTFDCFGDDEEPLMATSDLCFWNKR